MLRLFKPAQEETPSPSLLRRVIETAKDLSPVEFTRPSLSNFSNNSYLLLSLITGTAANWVCFTKDNIPYSFECDNFLNGDDLQGHLINLLNTSCAINMTSKEDCLYYRNTHQYFGSSGYNVQLCELKYPRLMEPDSCIIDNLQNHTPTHQFGTTRDVITTIQIVALGSVTALTFFGAVAAAAIRNNNRSDARNTEQVPDEETGLNPSLGM